MALHRIEIKITNMGGEPVGGVSEDVPTDLLERVATEMANSAIDYAINGPITPLSEMRPELVPASEEEFERACAAEGIGPPDGEG